MPDPIQGVNTTDPVTPTTASQTSASNATAASATPAPGASGADLADVGQTEVLLQSIIKAANDVPGIDQAKIAELQQAVASGTYQANPQAIAQKFVELENQLVTAGLLR